MSQQETAEPKKARKKNRGTCREFPELRSQGMRIRIPVITEDVENGKVPRSSKLQLNAPSATWEATVRLWIDACLQTVDDHRAFVTSRDLYASFVKWIVGSGEAPGSMRKLSRFLVSVGLKKGIAQVRKKNMRVILGIRMRAAPLRSMAPLHEMRDPLAAWVRNWDVAYLGEAPAVPDAQVTARTRVQYLYKEGVQYILHIGFEFYSEGWIKITRMFGEDGVVDCRIYPEQIATAFFKQLRAKGFEAYDVWGNERERYERVLSWRIMEGRRREQLLREEFRQSRVRTRRTFGIDVLGSG